MSKRHEPMFCQRGYMLANKLMKRFLTSLAIREMQIKAIFRYYCTTIRITKIKIIKTPNDGEDIEKLDYTYIAGGNVK